VVNLTLEKKYQPTWNSLKKHRFPEWLDDAKYGIYFHWGPYSVAACGKNGSWYPHLIYNLKITKQHRYHKKKFGPLSEFGYKDLIPLLTAEKFNAEEWANFFKQVGAKFAGPVAVHHDGFCMWNSKVSKWNAFNMGPKRDIVGEMEKVIKKQGMKFFVAFHHAFNWYYFPHWKKKYDTSDPEYSGLYGPIHNQDAGRLYLLWNRQDKPNIEFLDDWKAKIIEVIDKYKPDLIWHDFGLGYIPDKYRREILAYYYNKAEEWGKEVEFFYKKNDLPPGVGLVDYERGRSNKLTYHKWISDSTVDNIGAWSYVKNASFKSIKTLVCNLIDMVSKNGYLVLNFGPKADGSIPEPTKNCLQGIGKWLEVNGEAIYGTTPWFVSGEGPTKLKKSGSFSERREVKYKPRDIRFTVKDNTIYAICLGWPGEEMTIKTIRKSFRKAWWLSMQKYCTMDESEIESIKMLGVDKELEWVLTDKGLKIKTTNIQPCDNAFVFKIKRS
jgi:alpha-L-fucosidase